MANPKLKRLIRLEEKMGYNHEDDQYLSYYQTLKNPSPDQFEKYFLITLKRHSLKSLILESMEVRDKHVKTRKTKKR